LVFYDAVPFPTFDEILQTVPAVALKTDLFRLIQSLSKSEKRFLKLYAGRHVTGNSNNYIELFNAIAGMTNYDKQQLRAKFAGRAFIKNLRFTKHYLYRLILKSLEHYHADKTEGFRLRSLITQSELLLEKGLTVQVGQLLKKAE